MGSSLPRHVRDKKFGFGGHGKRDRQNTRSSTDYFGGRRGGVRAGVGVIVGWGNCAAYQRVDIKSRFAIIDSELRPEDLPLNSARLLYLCLQ